MKCDIMSMLVRPVLNNADGNGVKKTFISCSHRSSYLKIGNLYMDRWMNERNSWKINKFTSHEKISPYFSFCFRGCVEIRNVGFILYTNYSLHIDPLRLVSSLLTLQKIRRRKDERKVETFH